MATATTFRGNVYRQKMKQWLLYCTVVALLLYVIVDLSFHYGTHCICYSSEEKEKRLSNAAPMEKSDTCATRDGHYETTSSKKVEQNPWNQMKWVGEAASCRVKGQLIEMVDNLNDFRRGYALKFSADVEDRTHLLPWLLASKTSELAKRQRRVYIDLGANRFASSVKWFLRMYPLDFTEVHAFEVDPRQWRAPKKKFDEKDNVLVSGSNPIRVNSTPSVPQWMMERVKVYYGLISDKDDPSQNSIDISRFIKEELRLREDDTVVVKMDIEGAEWPILRRWMEDPLMPGIIDELFVEVHYANPSMSIYGWDNFAPISREDASRLLADLRWRGFYAHFWP